MFHYNQFTFPCTWFHYYRHQCVFLKSKKHAQCPKRPTFLLLLNWVGYCFQRCGQNANQKEKHLHHNGQPTSWRIFQTSLFPVLASTMFTRMLDTTSTSSALPDGSAVWLARNSATSTAFPGLTPTCQRKRHEGIQSLSDGIHSESS